MNEMNMMENLQAFGVNRVLGLLKDNPETNLPKLMDWIDRLDRDNTVLGQRKIFHDILDNPENNWYRFILSL